MPESTANPYLVEQGAGVGDILLLVLCLALILAGVYFATRFFARAAQRGTIFQPRGGFLRGQQKRHIVLVDRMMLDREKSIVLFDAEGKRYLVGVSGQTFTPLGESDAPPRDETAEEAAIPFRDMFMAWRKKQGDAMHAPEDAEQQ